MSDDAPPEERPTMFLAPAPPPQKVARANSSTKLSRAISSSKLNRTNSNSKLNRTNSNSKLNRTNSNSKLNRSNSNSKLTRSTSSTRLNRSGSNSKLPVSRSGSSTKLQRAPSSRRLPARQMSGRSSSQLNIKEISGTLTSKGIKHGVVQVSRAHYMDENGEIMDDQILWTENRRHFKSNCMEALSSKLVWIRVIPPDPDDMFTLTMYLLWVQWLVLICDIAAALVAIFQFKDVTYCCGKPIMDLAGNMPWEQITQTLTYAYLVLVLLELYPVIRKGFPFNIVNPLIGFVITIAMFFTDTVKQALSMWAVETTAVACEFMLYRLKIRHSIQQEKKLREVGLKTIKLRPLRDGEDPDAPERELKEMRQKLYQLKSEHVYDKSMLWYLGVGVYLNAFLSLVVVVLIIVIAQGHGLCFTDFTLPNPFDLNQRERCPLCEGVDGYCEVCTDIVSQCFFPYGEQPAR